MNSTLLAALLQSGATTSALPSAWREALIAQGATDGSLSTYLVSQGYSGTVADMFAKYLRDKGYVGTLADMLSAASAANDLFGFDPETIILPSVYGDWFRSDLSVPASSGGLLTRWTGLRDDAVADAGACFDLTPYASSPTVGAYGPAGEIGVRLQNSSTFIGHSVGRGGSAGIDLPSPFNASNDSAGFTMGFRVSSELALYAPRGNGGSLEYEGIYRASPNTGSNKWGRTSAGTQATFAGYSYSPGDTLILRKNSGTGPVDVSINGSVIAVGGATTGNWPLDQWYLLNSGFATGCSFISFFFMHQALSDANIQKMSDWMAAG